MKITLVSPFRTLLNIDTDRAYAGANHFSVLLGKASTRASQTEGVTYTSHRRPPPERPFTKYTHLDQRLSTWFTQPLSEAELSAELIGEMEDYAEQKMDAPLCATQTPTRVHVDIHDNTLAIMTLELEFDEELLLSRFSDPVTFETYLTEYAAACARHAEDHVIQPFLEALTAEVEATSDWPSAKHLLRKPKAFLTFNDLEHHDFPVWNTLDEPSLWTHRIFHLDTRKSKTGMKLTQLLRAEDLPKEAPYIVRSGTSYISKAKITPEMVRLNALSQYFYCMLDALNLSQKRLMRQIVDRDKGVNISDAYARFDRQENMLSEMQNELLDFRTQLQDQSSEMFEAIQTAFRTEKLIEAMQYRSGLLHDKLDRAARRKSLLQQKMLTFILVLVGSIQVIGLVISFFGYAQGVDEDDAVPGVTDIVQSVPFDLAMSVLVLALIIIAAIWAIRTERQARLRD